MYNPRTTHDDVHSGMMNGDHRALLSKGQLYPAREGFDLGVNASEYPDVILHRAAMPYNRYLVNFNRGVDECRVLIGYGLEILELGDRK